MKQEKFSVRKRLKSFVHAFNGLRILIREEHNSRIHLLAAVIAIALGWCLHISYQEWITVILLIGFVFFAELFNSSLEQLSDHLSPEKHENIRKVKDLAAAAVLVSAMTSLIIGGIIFLPKIFKWMNW